MATTWTISRRQGTCAATGRAFEDGERHASLLQVSEGTLERVDLCLEAWRERKASTASGDHAEPLFFWFTRHEVERKKTVQLDMESLDQLFVQLEGRPELSVRELRYVLCLLLMRKRRVKVEKVLRENGEESFIVKRPRDDTRYAVYVYDFEPERLDEVRAQLQAVFDGAEGPHGIRLGDEDPDAAEGDGVEGSTGDTPEHEPEDRPGDALEAAEGSGDGDDVDGSRGAHCGGDDGYVEA